MIVAVVVFVVILTVGLFDDTIVSYLSRFDDSEDNKG